MINTRSTTDLKPQTEKNQAKTTKDLETKVIGDYLEPKECFINGIV